MTPEQMAELAARLHDFGKAYPVEIFPEITDAERAEHSRLITRAAAQMGRHFAKFAVPAADLIESMAQRVLDEPVAFRDPETGDFSRVCRVGWQPLYLYPQSTSDAQRVPLTDEQIDAALKTDPAMVPALMIGELTVGEFKIVLRRLARVIEQAHGIRSDK